MVWDEDKIDDYLLGNMKAPEKKQFEKALETDPDLAANFEAQKNAKRVLEALNDRDLKDQVKRVHDSQKQNRALRQTGGKRRWLLPILSAAAIFVLLLVNWFGHKPVLPSELFDTYYQTPKIAFNSRDASSDKVLANAGAAISSADYAKALPLLESALTARPENGKARFALAVCYLEMGQTEKALLHFNFIIDQNYLLYRQEAEWNKILILIKTGDKEPALKMLQPFVNDPNAWNHEKAKLLMEELMGWSNVFKMDKNYV